jgi:alkanesulfonate monooxygenase SsuD/methylene tetrahydromethanopterin reductase-like flavin-dependent oxidoreductase (luciferase family)
MEFGFYIPNQDPPRGERIVDFYQEVVDMVAHGDALGFSNCVASEHHGRPDGYIPSPLVLCGALATRTKQIELGTGVMLLPLWWPIRVAEDSALIDIISGGRFALGVGLGLVPREFAMYGLETKEARGRMEESVAVLRAAWGDGPFDFDGKHFQFEATEVTPKPVQGAALPIYMGGQSAPAIERAGRIGDSWQTDPLHGMETMKVWAEMYREAARAAGREPRVHLMRDCWIADTDADLQEEFGHFLEDDWRYYFELGSFKTGRFNAEAEPWLLEIEDSRELKFERLREDRVIAGDVDEVREEVGRWIEAIQPDRFNLRFRLPYGPKHEDVKRVMERFAREVMPHFT